MSKKDKMGRREALKIMGAASTLINCPMKLAFGSILSNIIDKAYAESPIENKVIPRNLIMFQLTSAPPRWTWEPLNPHDDISKLRANPNVATCFRQADLYKECEYKTVNINGVNMPWLWQCDLPTASGGSVKMQDLMSNMLMIKGVNVVNPDHTGAQSNQFYPGGSPYSITSLTGDISDRPIPFIGLRTSTNPYLSILGKSGVNSLPSEGNLIKIALAPFLHNAPTFSKEVQSADESLKDIFSGIDTFLKGFNSHFSSLSSNHTNALNLIKKDFGDLEAEFENRKKKYMDILTIATSPLPIDGTPLTRLNGINDNPIDFLIETKEMRTYFKSKMIPDLIPVMAIQFAMIEYCFINQLTTSMAAGLSEIKGHIADEHSINVIQSTFCNSLWNRGFAACLNELITQFKNENIWDDTLIYVSAEFGRTPKGWKTPEEAEIGSDHGPGSTCVTLFSGSIEGKIVGDTLIGQTTGTYPGTWGQGSSNNEGVGRITLGHIASTMADILKVHSPVTSAKSLVKLENGKYVSILGPSKLVKS